jgi:pimeloyl-ACP methyl ester carboxylesterase
MNLKRTITIGASLGALAAWLAAAATSGVRERPAAIAPAAPIDSRGTALAVEVQRLHERLRPAAAPRQPSRNLFTFSAPKPKAAPADHAAISEALPAMPAAAPPPPLKLSGMAEDAGPDGTPVRTAIISAAGQLFLVKPGDPVTSRYRVEKVSADAVELIDLTSNGIVRLVLK